MGDPAVRKVGCVRSLGSQQAVPDVLQAPGQVPSPLGHRVFPVLSTLLSPGSSHATPGDTPRKPVL